MADNGIIYMDALGCDEPVAIWRRHPVRMGLFAVAVPFATYKLIEWLGTPEALSGLLQQYLGLVVAGHSVAFWQEAIIIAAWVALFVREFVNPFEHARLRSVLRGVAFVLGAAIPVGMTAALIALFGVLAVAFVPDWQTFASLLAVAVLIGAASTVVYVKLWKRLKMDELRLALFSVLSSFSWLSGSFGLFVAEASLALVSLIVLGPIMIFVMEVCWQDVPHSRR